MNLRRLIRSSKGLKHVAIAATGVCVLIAIPMWRGAAADSTTVVTVQKGSLTVELASSGTLIPVQSVTYRSPLAGREAEIVYLAAEGTRVKPGDLLVQLDTTELQREVARAQDEARQAHMDHQVAGIELQEAEASLKAVTDGEGALAIEETRTRLQLAQGRADRLRDEYDQLKSLLDRGYITREELKKTAAELQQSEDEAALARKRAAVVVEQTHPRERRRAELQLAQKRSQLANAQVTLTGAQLRVQAVKRQIDDCRIAARRSGLVIYEEFLSASPRRKIRVGDRVTGSQGLITIPEVDRMLVEASVTEADVHRVHPGQAASVRVEAFPDLRLSGRVIRVGALARASAGGPLEDKRFDLIIALDSTPADLRPEMTARADIIVGTRLDVLLVPVSAIFEKDAMSVVAVVKGSRIESRQVTLGESNDLVVEVASGLREGEHVALADGEMTRPALSAVAPWRSSSQSQPGLGGSDGSQPR